MYLSSEKSFLEILFLFLHAKLERFARGIAKGSVASFVNGEQAVSFDVTAVIVDELEKFKPKLKA